MKRVFDKHGEKPVSFLVVGQTGPVCEKSLDGGIVRWIVKCPVMALCHNRSILFILRRQGSDRHYIGPVDKLSQNLSEGDGR